MMYSVMGVFDVREQRVLIKCFLSVCKNFEKKKKESPVCMAAAVAVSHGSSFSDRNHE